MTNQFYFRWLFYTRAYENSENRTDRERKNGGPRQAADTMPLAALSHRVYPVCASGIIDVS